MNKHFGILAAALALAACSSSSSSSSSGGTTTASSSTTTTSASSSATSSSSSGGSTASSSSSTASSSSSASGGTSASTSSSSASSATSGTGSSGTASGSSTASSSSSGGTTGSQTGTLTVDVNVSVTDAGAPSVLVTGDGSAQTLDATSDLTVAEGVYTVTAAPLVTFDGIVGDAYAPSIVNSPVTVDAGAHAFVTVSYSAGGKIPGSGMLWAPNDDDGTIEGFASADLHADGGTLTPTWVLATDGGYGEAIAFDPAGNLWALNVTSSGDNSVVLWTFALHADGGADAKTLVPQFEDGGALQVQSFTFAANGDLWFADCSQGAIGRLTAAQAQGSGAVVPAQFIDSNVAGATLSCPYGLAFDASGNAWIVNNGSVMEFPLLDDAGIGEQPVTTLLDYADAGLIPATNGLSFDSNGDLWVVNYNPPQLVRLHPAHASGTQVAAPLGVVRDDPDADPVLQGPDYVTFDQSGRMWLLDQTAYQISVYDDPRSITGDTIAAPLEVFGEDLDGDTGKFAFYPPAPGLGLLP